MLRTVEAIAIRLEAILVVCITRNEDTLKATELFRIIEQKLKNF